MRRRHRPSKLAQNTQTINRRQALTLAALAGGTALIGGGTARSQIKSLFATASPPTTPFLDPLPISPIARPVAPFSTLPDPLAVNVDGSTTFHVHGPRSVPSPASYYIVRERAALHSFHRQLPPNLIWGYDGIVPGPTFFAQTGTASLVRFVNNLPANDPVGIGTPISAIHHHGGHQAPEDDGYPVDTFSIGQSRDYLYPNRSDEGLVQNSPSTHWYHDHAIDVTAENVYRGLSGFYLNFDEIDSLAGEADTSPYALKLPGRMRTLDDGNVVRDFDIPIVLQDKQFDARGFLAYDGFNHNGFIGDKFLANGKIQPFLNVARRKYRFRFLNGSNARVFDLFLRNNRPFDYVIASDDFLFETPLINVQNIRMASAERYEVVIDFSKYKIGDHVILENRLEQFDGRKPAGLVNQGVPVLKFIVAADPATPDISRVPTSLRPLSETVAQLLPRAKVRRTFKFERSNGAWQINGELFDENRIDAKPKIGEPEIWSLEAGGGWLHPIHLHSASFFVLSRDGKTPPLLERGRKDVVRIGADEKSVEVLLKFTDYPGRFVFHCHTTEHEDMRMMGQFEVVP
jgi:FtsP/CotA-like multicopper oxidase with cupredoxin domain